MSCRRLPFWRCGLEKIRVLFPFIEAGFGHIMPMKSVWETFEKKYGDRAEVIRSDFYQETGSRPMARYEKMISNQVRLYNRLHLIGWLVSSGGELLGTRLSSFIAVRLFAPFAYRDSLRHLEELKPDVVFSTHWASNYCADRMEGKKPLLIMYCPDATLNSTFRYRADLTAISMPKGYETALRKYRKYNEDNLKMVPFLIRNEAFKIETDKAALRKRLGLPEQNFTIVLAEGGYGIGRMGELCEFLVREHLPLTIIPVCGKNERLYRHLLKLKPAPEITFLPLSFTEKILEYEAASDLFMGKSGNILAEATFFGVPTVVTNCSTKIEYDIADHYVHTVGCAMMELVPLKVVHLIRQFVKDPSALKPYRDAAQAYHDHFGSEAMADLIWQTITEAFPDRRELK